MASAIDGLLRSVPAKPTNQVTGPPSSDPVSAVPVLPATDTPATWALEPVPSLTACCMREDRVCAVFEEIGVRASFGVVVLTTLRSESSVCDTRYGFICLPLLAMVSATWAIMSGVARTEAWPIPAMAVSAWLSLSG